MTCDAGLLLILLENMCTCAYCLLAYAERQSLSIKAHRIVMSMLAGVGYELMQGLQELLQIRPC